MPIFTLNDGTTQHYCLIHLEENQSPLFVVNGTGIPPSRIDESFLSAQPQFSYLSAFIQFVMTCCEQAITLNSTVTLKLEDEPTTYQVDATRFNQLYKNAG
jgi:hypothetical protein